jgi:hypothetical protein
VAPAELAELAETDPSVLVVNEDDMARALASALAYGGRNTIGSGSDTGVRCARRGYVEYFPGWYAQVKTKGCSRSASTRPKLLSTALRVSSRLCA